ncbi:MAG: UDP-N-acetylglucosamine 1-carboxyvinyltransferase, partial [Erysipelotrichia bacterium]|nr:UDP-N-acetylglucosamine 1-carboxyvinyltransferase [Erysipelotrichia bacterium]
MDYLKIIGNQKLSGEIYISGAKNAALPLIAATILAKNETIINNLPNVADINTFLKLIKMLGGSFTQDKNRAIIDTSTITNTTA